LSNRRISWQYVSIDKKTVIDLKTNVPEKLLHFLNCLYTRFWYKFRELHDIGNSVKPR